MKFQILLYLFLPLSLLAQKQFGVQLREGLITIDQFKASIDPVGIYQDIAFKSEAFMTYYHSGLETANVGIGLGYSHINFFGVSEPSLSYLASRFSFDWKFAHTPLILQAELTGYVLPHNNFRHALHKRFYSNLLLGLGREIGKHLRVSLLSPISILAIYRGELGVLKNGSFVTKNISAEELGLYFAIEYRF